MSNSYDGAGNATVFTPAHCRAFNLRSRVALRESRDNARPGSGAHGRDDIVKFGPRGRQVGDLYVRCPSIERETTGQRDEGGYG